MSENRQAQLWLNNISTGFTNVTVAGFEPTTPRSEDFAATNELNKLFIYRHNSNVTLRCKWKVVWKLQLTAECFCRIRADRKILLMLIETRYQSYIENLKIFFLTALHFSQCRSFWYHNFLGIFPDFPKIGSYIWTHGQHV